MHTTLWSATSTFGLTTAAGMAHKAWRDYERFKAARTTGDRIDAALNCAITLWHMSERVWAGIAAPDRHSTAVAAKVSGVLMDAIIFWGHQLTNEGAMR